MKTTIETAYFTRFTLDIPAEAVADCSHQGACDDDVEAWSSRIDRPSDITPKALRAELKEYGAWDAEELADDDANWRRIIWLAACDIKEELASQAKGEA